MRKKMTHNNPIAGVIKNYMNKKSGKVTESRKEIQRRFFGLDWKDQKKIINAFLDSGSSDRNWAYTRLLDLWDDGFETKIKDLWELRHEERCAWVVIRHFPLEYLKRHMDELKEGRNYYFICRRMADDADYEINRDQMEETDYLMALYHANRHVTDSEAMDILFKTVRKICAHWWPSLLLSRSYRLDRNVMMEASDFSGISLALYYLKRMGNEEAVEIFNVWDDEMQAGVRHSPEYTALLKQPLSDHDLTDRLATIVQKHMNQYLPEKYRVQREECED